MVFMLWQRLDPRQVFCSYLVILLCSLSDHQQMYMYPYVSLMCTGTKLSRRRETKGMTLANSGQGKLTPTLRPNLPDPTLLTWMKMVSSTQLPHGSTSKAIPYGNITTPTGRSPPLTMSLEGVFTTEGPVYYRGACLL